VEVGHQLQQIIILFDENRLVSTLKEVPLCVCAPVEPLGVTKGEVLHDAGQGNLANLQGKVDMIGHQAEGMHPKTKALNAFLYQKKKTVTVFIFCENICATIATQHDMIECARIMNAGFTSHGLNVSQVCNIASLTPL